MSFQPQDAAVRSKPGAGGVASPLPPLDSWRTVSVSQSSRPSPRGQTQSSMAASDSPVQRRTLSDGPFLVRDKVAALERYPVMITMPPRPSSPQRKRPVPLPVTVVGMQSTGAAGSARFTSSEAHLTSSTELLSNGKQSAVACIPPDVHEAIIASTVARLTHVFQNRLQEHAIAATVRCYTTEFIEEAVRSNRPPTLVSLSALGSQSARAPTAHSEAAYGPSWVKAIAEPPTSSTLHRAASPGGMWKKDITGRSTLAHSAVPVQPNASSTTPSVMHMLSRDSASALQRHPAVIASWAKKATRPIELPSLHPQHELAPLADAALSQILTHHNNSAGNNTAPVKVPFSLDWRATSSKATTRAESSQMPQAKEPLAPRPPLVTASKAPQSSLALREPPQDVVQPAQRGDASRGKEKAQPAESWLIGSEDILAAISDMALGDGRHGSRTTVPKRDVRDAVEGELPSLRDDGMNTHASPHDDSFDVSGPITTHVAAPRQAERTQVSAPPRGYSRDQQQRPLKDWAAGVPTREHGVTSSPHRVVSTAPDELSSHIATPVPASVFAKSAVVPQSEAVAILFSATTAALSLVNGGSGAERNLSPKPRTPADSRRHVASTAPAISVTLNAGSPPARSLSRTAAPVDASKMPPFLLDVSDLLKVKREVSRPLPDRSTPMPIVSTMQDELARLGINVDKMAAGKNVAVAEAAAAKRVRQTVKKTVNVKNAMQEIVQTMKKGRRRPTLTPGAAASGNVSVPVSGSSPREAALGALLGEQVLSDEEQHARRKDSAATIPESLQKLLPVGPNVILPPLPATSDKKAARLLSTDYTTLEAQVERDVIKREYDALLAPLRATKASVDASAAVLQKAVAAKLELRENLIKKYDALQQVKESHVSVMTAIQAVHACLVSGKTNGMQGMPLDAILAAMDTVMEGGLAAGGAGAATTNDAAGRRKSFAKGGTSGAARRRSLAGRSQSVTVIESSKQQGGKDTEATVRRTKSIARSSEHVVALDATGSPSSRSVTRNASNMSTTSSAGFSVDSGESDDDTSGSGSDEVASGARRSSEAAPRKTGESKPKKRKASAVLRAASFAVSIGAQRSKASQDGQTEDDASGPNTAELLKQAHRNRLASLTKTPTAQGSDGAVAPRSRILRSVGGALPRGSPMAPKQMWDELELQRTVDRAGPVYQETLQRFQDAHAYLINHGRHLLRQKLAKANGKNQNTPKSPAPALQPSLVAMLGSSDDGSSAAASPVSALSTLAADGAKSAALTPAEEKEAIVAAITEELQAEFRDITARRDAQRSVAETQESELDDIRQDMKRLNSGSEQARDEAAAMLGDLVHRREMQLEQQRQDPFAAALLGMTNDVDPLAQSTRTPLGGSTKANSYDGHDVNAEDNAFRHRSEYVEIAHTAVQADDSVAPAPTAAEIAAAASQSVDQAQMEDLYRLERTLLASVRRLMVAVANIVVFHQAIEVELTCTRCLNLLTAPRILWPCGHVFCNECLTEMYQGSEIFTCVDCNTLTDIGFTPDCVVESIVQFSTQYRSLSFRRAHQVVRNGAAGGIDKSFETTPPLLESPASVTRGRKPRFEDEEVHGHGHSLSPDTTHASLQEILDALIFDLSSADV